MRAAARLVANDRVRATPVSYRSLTLPTTDFQIRTLDTKRAEIVIQNRGSVNVSVGYRAGATVVNDLNPPTSYTVTIPPGSELVAVNEQRPVWGKAASGTADILVKTTLLADNVSTLPTASSVVQTTTTVLPSVSVTPTFVDSGAINIVGISRDRTVLYGAGNASSIFYTSSDKGANWTSRYTIPVGGGAARISAARQTAGGEVLLAVIIGAAPGRLYRSSGWVANPATATWSSVLTTSGNDVYLRGEYGGLDVSYDSAVCIATEYGVHTHEGQTGQLTAVRSYLSQDNGATWTEIFNLLTTLVDGSVRGSSTNSHMHGGCWDPWWERIWLTYGDGGSTGKNGIIYSDDLGATWHLVATSESTSGSVRQSVAPIALAKGVVFQTDGSPASIFRVGRNGYRTMSSLEAVHNIWPSSGAIIGYTAYQPRDLPGHPALLCMTQTATRTAGTGLSWLVATDGEKFWHVHRDTAAVAAFNGYLSAFVASDGAIVGTTADGRQTNKSRFTISSSIALS